MKRANDCRSARTGGKSRDFTIATFYVGGGEDGGDTFAGYRFREDKIPIVKVQPDIFLEGSDRERDSIARVETGVADSAAVSVAVGPRPRR